PAVAPEISVLVAAAHVDAERQRRIGRLLFGRYSDARVQNAVLLVALLDLDHHRDDLALLVLARERDRRRVVEQLQKTQVALAALDRRGGQVAARLQRDLFQDGLRRGLEVSPHEDRADAHAGPQLHHPRQLDLIAVAADVRIDAG